MFVYRFVALVALLTLVRPLAGPVAYSEEVPSSRTAMIERINVLLAERWEKNGVAPAARCSDEEFLRRAYLDLTGVIPSVSQARAFLSNPDSEKRSQLIEELLNSPGHATHLANTWRNIMLPRGFEPDQANSIAGVQNWLRGHFVENMRYDRIVSDLLVATGGGDSGPALFYSALDLKPEELAANTARIFLGLQIQCAQCHDHPMDHWTQDDFWGYAAFFARLQRQDQPQPLRGAVQLVDLDTGEVSHPITEEPVPPRYPGAGLVHDGALGTRRQQLSIWMASRDNPYLARAAVNWAWSHVFGRGLVEPVDDIGPHNPPSHPRLLEELTEYFVNIGFDLRELFRTLTAANAYHLSSRVEEDEPPAELFARMIVKVMTPEQLYDSLTRASLRNPTTAAGPGGGPVSPLFDPRRRAFVARMASSGREAWEYSAGPPQALMIMNGPEMTAATNPAASGMLQALQAPWMSDEDRIETLFLATYSRPPSERERSQFVSYVKAGGTNGDPEQALGDVFWVLLNSAEFSSNH